MSTFRHLLRTLCTATTTPSTGSKAGKASSRWALLREARKRAPPPKHRGNNEPITHAQDVHTALRYVKERAWASFDESIDFVLRLGVDVRQAEQTIRTYAFLPKGHGREMRVAVFDDTIQHLPDVLCGEDLLDEVVRTNGKIMKNMHVAIAHHTMVDEVRDSAGRVLGPRGLLPTTKDGTVVNNVLQELDAIKNNWVRIRTDRAGNVHVPVGKVSFEVDHLAENIATVVSTVREARPVSVKKRYIRKAFVSSTMGRSIELDLGALMKLVAFRV